MSYVIVTTAYNEEKYIRNTIESVLAQTERPYLWIIVDDGSTDQTASIVKKYCGQYSWIRYQYRKKIEGQTYYASNVHALLEGMQSLREISFDYLGVLDADITLPSDYYCSIMKVFSRIFSHSTCCIMVDISSGVQPDAYKPPITLPILVPTIRSIGILYSFSEASTPICAKPRAPPPLSTNPTFGFR